MKLKNDDMTNVQKLKELGVYEKYLHNLKFFLHEPLFDSLGDIDSYLNAVRPDWVVANAFSWGETPEGHGFWSDIDKKFMAL